MTDRFTAEMHIKVPQGMRVFASGGSGTSKLVTLSNGKPGSEFDFKWDQARLSRHRHRRPLSPIRSSPVPAT
jgi:hypothetical protein